MNNSNEKQTLPERLEKLEQLAKSNLDDALVGMIDMFEEASDSYFHEIVDTIIFWIVNKGNISTLDYLSDKVKETQDEYCSEIFRDCIRLLKNKE